MFDDEIVDAVAVQIGDSHHSDTADVVLQLEGPVLLYGRIAGKLGHLGGFPLAAAHDGPDEPRVGPVQRGLVIDEIGGLVEGLPMESHRYVACGRAIDIERHVLRVALEQAPAKIDPAVPRCDRQHTAIELLFDTGFGPAQHRIGIVQRVHRIEIQVRRDFLRRERSKPAFVIHRRASTAESAPHSWILRRGKRRDDADQ